MAITDQRAESAADGPPLLRLTNLSKTFAYLQVLQSFNLELRPAEIHALVGKNVSGKSTLIRILSGIHQPDPRAQAWFRDMPVPLGHGGAAAYVAGVHQDLGLIGSLSTVDNQDTDTSDTSPQGQ